MSYKGMSMATIEKSTTQFTLLKAIDFAAHAHRNQRRKNADKTPYINHPIGVMLALSECKVTDDDVLVAAVLHDTVEDTDVTLLDISNKFGPRVAGLVASVSDDKSLTAAERKRLQIVHVRDASKDTKLIKMADKLNNLTDLTKTQPAGWSPERIQGYFVWSNAVIEECRGVNQDLEERLDDVLNSQFEIHGKKYDCIPKNVDLALFLQDYYVSL